MNKCDCYISNKYQLISNESINFFTLDELMRLVNRLKVNRSFVYTVSNLAELNEIFKYYPTKEQTVEILGGATGIVPVAQNLTEDSIDYAWLDYYTKEEVIAFINTGFIPELPAKTYVFTVNPTPATATVTLNGEVRNSIVVYEGEEVIWQVEDSGFTTQIGILNVTENTTIDVVLDEVETGGGSEDPVPVYTVCIEPTPSDANVYINGVKQNCITKGAGAVATYDVMKSGYIPQSGTININANKTISVVLEVQPEKPIEYYTLTINPTPTDALVVLNGVEQNTITVEKGTVVEWSVSKLGYFSRSGSQRITEDVTLDIELIEDSSYIPNYSFCINATPEDSIVTINGFTQPCLEVQEGDLVSWSVEKEGYITEMGQITVTENKILDIDLEEYVPKEYTLAIYPIPDDATVIINGESRRNITVVEGTSVTYTVSKEGYVSQSETLIVNSDINMQVSLRELGRFAFTINPYPSYAVVEIDGELTNTIYRLEGTVVTWTVRLTGYNTQAGTFQINEDSSINVYLDCLNNPQTVSTLNEYRMAGAVDGVIDLCSYDLTPYTGDLSYDDYVGDAQTDVSYLPSTLRYFEGDLISNGRTYLNCAFVDLANLKEVAYLGENGDIHSAIKMLCGANNVEYANVASFGGANLTDTLDMFYKAYKLHTVDGLETWTGTPTYVNMEGMFADCYELNSDVFFPNWKPQILTARWMFQNCRKLERFKMNDVAVLMNKVTSDLNDTTRVALYGMFLGCTSLKSVVMNNWDVRECSDFTGMFNGCSSLTDVSSLATWNFDGGDLSQFFDNCNSLVDVSFIRNWNGTNTDFYRTFRNCSSLQEVDLTSFSTNKFMETFEGCNRLRSVRIQFNSTNWGENSRADRMFAGCTSLTEVYCTGMAYFYTCSGMFSGIETTGTLHYPAEYASYYTKIINEIPSTWTAVAY